MSSVGPSTILDRSVFVLVVVVVKSVLVACGRSASRMASFGGISRDVSLSSCSLSERVDVFE